MSITLAAAAKLCGVDKSTLRRAVRAGKISAARDEHGVWRVEMCEVERVYAPVASAPEQPQGASEALPRHAVGPDVELAVRAAVAEQELAQLKRVVEELRSDRDHWRGQAERLSITAAAAPAPKPTAVPAVTVVRRSWWWRRAG